MMRSLYSGVSGLRIHQTKMDVIGNNIANVNSVGFKSSSAIFSDIFYQKIQGATGPNAETGAAGRNPMQIGLGANIATVKTAITTTGGSQRTDAPWDLMISGDSFFIVNNGGVNYFTKAGAFQIDATGTLSMPTGATVMGWMVDPNDPSKTVQDTVQPLRIMTPENQFSEPEATRNVHITGNIDRNDTQIAPGTKGKAINMSFFDNMGNGYNADIKVVQTAGSNNVYEIKIEDIKDSEGHSIFLSKTAVDANGNPTASSITTFTLGGATYTAAVANGEVTLTATGTAPLMTFDGGNGKFVSVGAAVTGTPPTNTSPSIKFQISASGNPVGNNPFAEIDIDFSQVTMYGTSGSTNLEPYRGAFGTNGVGAGRKVGNMTGVDIDQSGKIYGKYDNGVRKLLGQIASTTFANPAGLESVGNSMFAQTQNSGEFDGVGKDITANGGAFSQGMLEMSNVDLSAQFTDMITTQRGFQANSRIITTSDSLLEELINLKR